MSCLPPAKKQVTFQDLYCSTHYFRIYSHFFLHVGSMTNLAPSFPESSKVTSRESVIVIKIDQNRYRYIVF